LRKMKRGTSVRLLAMGLVPSNVAAQAKTRRAINVQVLSVQNGLLQLNIKRNEDRERITIQNRRTKENRY
jgi:hypothetical protein